MNENKKKKTSLIKRLLKWLSISILILLIALISIPYLFKDKIVEMVSTTINNSVNATVTFEDVELSLLKSFPLANLTVKELAVVNKEPFVGDTLFNAKELSFKLKITELFKKAEEVIELKSIATNNGQINIIVNKEGIGNYDIAIKDESINENADNNDSFSFNIQDYEVENIDFSYVDKSSNIKLQLDNIYHSGEGNFMDDVLDLDTKTTAKLSLDLENVNYIHDVSIGLDAVLGIDLKNSKYSFKENTGTINQLPLEFNGFIQLIDETQLYDINFKTPTSSFKNLLALLPKQYSGNLKTIKTAGNFDLNGVVKGILSEKTIPTFDISFSSKNAMFKYDDLPKSVEKINLNSKIINKTGLLKDTYLNVNKLTFTVDKDDFSANGNVSNLTTNPRIDIATKGTINLENIGKVYPAAMKKQLSGILKADVISKFDMNSVEKGRYQNIKNAGVISVSNFKYEGDDVANPFYIGETSITFNTNTIKLNKFDAKTGSSDISVTGNLDNFYGFLFKDQKLKGDFNLNSNTLKVADFLSKEEKNENEETSSTLKIPSFLDVKLKAKANTVVYDNMNLTNVSGDVLIKDESVSLQNLKTDVFDGNIGINGKVSTKGDVSSFTMNLDLKQLNIADSFSNLDMLKSIAPIAKTIEGKINSTIKVSGNLNEDMTPDLKTISGNLLGQLRNTKLKAGNSKVLTLLGEKVSFLDINKLNLNEASALLSFNNGEVTVKPFNLKYQDIGIQIGGKHSFDNAMSYDIVFDVPVKYLGTEVTNAIAKLTPKDAESVKSIPVKANLTGSFLSPNLTTNIKDATSNLMKDLVEKQKQSLINKGKDKLLDLLGGGKKDSDSTKTKDKPKDKIKDLLGGLFGKKKKDTVKKN